MAIFFIVCGAVLLIALAVAVGSTIETPRNVRSWNEEATKRRHRHLVYQGIMPDP